MDNTNKNKNKDILNYESKYGKDLHEKTLMEETRKKEIKKYEKDHENNSKERINIYVDNLNIDKFDNSSNSHNTKSNADNDYSWRPEVGHDLNLDWQIPVSDPIEENSIAPQLPKSNKLDSDYNEKELIKYFENLKEEIDTIIELLKYKEDKLLDKEFLNIIIKMLNRIKSKGDDKNEINR